MVYKSFNNIMREYMDYSDNDTIQTIIEASNKGSAGQAQLLTALTSKLYDLIVAKADKIDYSSITRSRGDITKIDHYDQLLECIDTIKSIVVAYKQNSLPVDTVKTTIDNLKSRTALFKKAYVMNNNLLVMTYNSIALAVVNSVSLMIATCIEFIKNPQDLTFQMALDVAAYNKAEHNVLFINLVKFNDACKDGDFDKAADGLMKNGIKIKKEAAFVPKEDKPFLSDTGCDDDDEDNIKDGLSDDTVVIHDRDDVTTESVGAILGTVVAVATILPIVLSLIIPILRDLTYYWFFLSQKVSDFFATQADLLEMNAYQMQVGSDRPDSEKKKIYDKQMKIVAKFRTISNKWAIDSNNAQKKADKLASDEARKYATSDLGDSQGSYNSGHDGSNGYDPTQDNGDGSILF